MTNRKLHMRFRLRTKSMTLDNLAVDNLDCYTSNFRKISRNFADLGGNNS